MFLDHENNFDAVILTLVLISPYQFTFDPELQYDDRDFGLREHRFTLVFRLRFF